MNSPLPDDIQALKSIIYYLPTPTALYTGEEMLVRAVSETMLWICEKPVADGMTFHSLFEGPVGDELREILAESYRTGNPYSSGEKYTEVRRSGTSKFFRFEVRPLKHPDGHVWGLLHTAMDMTELVKVRQHLSSRVSHVRDQQKLLSLIENSVDFMGISNMDLKLEYLNRNGRKLIGLDEDQDITNIHVKDLYSPQNFSVVREKIDPALRKRGRWSGKLHLRNFKTGEDIPFYANFIQVYDPDTGAAVGRGATLRDLRSEIAANEALVLSEKRFRNLVQNAPVAIGILRGSDLKVEVANDEILKLLGKDKSVVGLSALEAVPEIIDQIFPELLYQVLSTGRPAHGNETPGYFHRNGKIEHGYFNFIFAPIKEVDDTVSGVIVVGNEVTDQVIYKKKLEESEKRFRSIVLEAPVAKALYVGKDMVIDLANESMIKLWGKDQSVIGKKLRDAIPELSGQPFLEILDNVYATGIPYHTERQHADLMVNGKLVTVWLNFTYKPLKDPQGNVYAILNTAVDISSQVHLQKQKDDFLGVASHELKTPVTSIKAYAQVLEAMLRNSGDREKANMVNKLDNQVSRLTNLISDLLDVTKINSGKIKFQRSYFDFNEMVKEMVEEVQRTTRKHRIVEDLQAVGEVYGDRERIGQVVVNLMTNAIKYSPDADKIKVVSHLKDGSVELCVEDYGIGISQEMQNKIFERFYRVSGEKHQTFPGLGLGLFISSEIIKREGGNIWVRSEEGRGSQFWFSVPLGKQKRV